MLLNIDNFCNWYLEMYPNKCIEEIRCQFFGLEKRPFFEEVNSYAKNLLGIKYTNSCCESCECKCYTCSEINEIQNKLNSFYAKYAIRDQQSMTQELKYELRELLVNYVDSAVY